MSGHIEISAALLARLTAASPGAAIASSLIKYEGSKTFTPPTSGLWYQAFFLPGEVNAAAIGADAPNRAVGVFQVTVYGPAQDGTKATDNEVERLRKCFARGTSLVYAGVYVIISKAYLVRPTQDEVSYFKQILKVQWWSDIAN
jgi:hypothetical protein